MSTSPPVRLVNPQVTAAASALEARVGDMTARRHDIGESVERLLRAWRGPAADAFGSHWEAWRDAADAVIGDLAGSIDGVRGVQDDLRRADDAASTASSRLLGRLG